MTTRKTGIRAFVVVLLMTATLGCQAAGKQNSLQAQNTVQVRSGPQSGAQSSGQTAVEQRDTASAFAADDFNADYSASSAKINVGSLANLSASGVRVSGKTVTISADGTYILSGTASDVSVIVDAPDAAVRLVLDNLTMTNSSAAPSISPLLHMRLKDATT